MKLKEMISRLEQLHGKVGGEIEVKYDDTDYSPCKVTSVVIMQYHIDANGYETHHYEDGCRGCEEKLAIETVILIQ